MAWYIGENGKDVLSYVQHSPSSVRLSDGRVIALKDLDLKRVFSVHPEENKLLKRVGGVWHYLGPWKYASPGETWGPFLLVPGNPSGRSLEKVS